MIFWLGILIILYSGFIFTQSMSIDKAWIVVFAIGLALTVWGSKDQQKIDTSFPMPKPSSNMELVYQIDATMSTVGTPTEPYYTISERLLLQIRKALKEAK